MSVPESSATRRLDIPYVDPVAEGALTALFQRLRIGRAGEPMMSDPSRLVTPREVVRQRRVSARDPLPSASTEQVLLKILEERSKLEETLTHVDFANVIAGWALVYGWNPPQQG